MAISRNTRQKEILTESVTASKSLFNAEELLASAQKSDPQIGIATVYRFLKELRKQGAIHSYQCNRKTIYSKESKSHCHFTCFDSMGIYYKKNY